MATKYPTWIRCRATDETLTFHNEVSLEKLRYIDANRNFRVIPSDDIAMGAGTDVDRTYVAMSCGQAWVAEIELCPRCDLSAGHHA